ncbi:MAG: hypothetical protein ABI843_13485 [Dokdonella sp.]
MIMGSFGIAKKNKGAESKKPQSGALRLSGMVFARTKPRVNIQVRSASWRKIIERPDQRP